MYAMTSFLLSCVFGGPSFIVIYANAVFCHSKIVKSASAGVASFDKRGSEWGRKMLALTLSEAAQPAIGTLHIGIPTSNEHATRLYRLAVFEAAGHSLVRLRMRP
jgi:hypothetical protein